MNLGKIEKLFNEQCDINKIIEDATKHVEKKLLESNNDIYTKITNEYLELNKLKIQYDRINLYFNQNDGITPSFKILFDLYEPNEDFALYFYELNYDYLGQFVDGNFGEYYPKVVE